MKNFLPAVLLMCAVTGCANYFSNYRTVYRVETTTGERYYTDSEPKENNDMYTFKDLDGNRYQLKKGRISNVEKFKHKK